MNETMILERLAACGLPADRQLAERLTAYHALLLDWNSRMDLTAVSEESEMLDKHYIDSLLPLTVPGLIPAEGTLIDVGTGAGFPGLPLAIACPGLTVTLMDAQQKRLTFLRAVIEALGLTNVTLVHARAEDGARQPALRGAFDLAVARAVAPLPVLAEYLLPFVKVGGRALCWKGPALAEELEQGRRACHLLGGKAGEPIPMPVPGRDWQHLILPIGKAAPTAKLYPRRAGLPSKQPLG